MSQLWGVFPITFHLRGFALRLDDATEMFRAMLIITADWQLVITMLIKTLS